MEPSALDKRWPLRLPPCPGELFSSWLVRLARCYEMPVQTFCRAVWPEREVWCVDIDRQIEDEALRFLSRKTGVAYEELFALTLRSHEQYTGTSDEGETRNLYFRLSSTDYATRYCSACLQEAQPYFRLEWRLVFVLVCPEHGVLLEERCPACTASCLFAKLDVQQPFGCCHNCHRWLIYYDPKRPRLTGRQIERQVAFQENLLSLFGRRPHGPKPAYSFRYRSKERIGTF